MAEAPSNTTDKVEGSESRTLQHSIKSAGAYAILLACLGLGATLSTIFWSASNSRLQQDLRYTQDELEKARLELDKVKTDLAAIKAKNPLIEDGHSTPGDVIVTAAVGSTAFVTDDLFISVLATQFETNPSRYTVTARIGSPHGETMNISKAEVGSIITYPGAKGRFAIQLIQVDALSARFLIRRKET